MDKLCFSQKHTSLIAATPTEYRLFNLADIDRTLRVRQITPKKGIRLIDGLWDESICVMVMDNHPTELILWDLIRKVEISNYNYPTPVMAVKLSHKVAVVFCEARILIHEIRDFKNNVKTHDIPANPARIWDFANRSEKYSLLVYKHYIDENERKTGKLQVFDTKSVSQNLDTGRVVNSFVADSKPLAAIAFSPKGTEIATVNINGTLVRIHDSITGIRLMELRRGHTGALVSALVFSTCGGYLVSASNKKTIHVFRVKLQGNDMEPSFAKTVRSMLPSFLNHDRAIAMISLPIAGSGRAFGITKLRGRIRLMVATVDGFLYVYTIQTASGEEYQGANRFNLREETLKMTVDLPPVVVDIDDDAPSTSAAALLSAAARSAPLSFKTAYEEEDLFST